MILRGIHRLEEVIICILLVAITCLVFTDVVLRFIFNAGLMWSQELTLNMSAWLVLFGASYGLKEGSHIGMDAFVRLFPSTARRVLSFVAGLLCLVYFYLILHGSWFYLARMRRIGLTMEDLPIPIWVANGMLFVGFILLTIRLLVILRAIVTGKMETFQHANEAKESLNLAREISKEEKR